MPIIAAMPGIVSNLYATVEDAWRYESDYSDYKDDLPLLSELAAAAGGPVLELGAGTGRVAIHLARRGIQVAALESSDGMIELFERKLASEDVAVRNNVRIVRGDMRTASFPSRFPLILAPFNFLQLITGRAERVALLRQCHHSLVNRGKLYLEIAAPHHELLTGKRVHQQYVKEFFDRNRRQWVTLFQSHEYYPAEQEITLEYLYVYHRQDGITERIARFVTLAVIFPVELDGLLEQAGFVVREKWGDFDKSRFGKASRRMIWLAEKP
ncbi:MAG: class I SAM-dependent methyltransferase [bacterium]|jgi:SAM-dependent methyltransferase